MQYFTNYSSHFAVLTKVMTANGGPVLEVGMGIFSTPLLHWLCLDQDRKLTSLESAEKYYKLNRRFASPNHEIILIKDWDKFNFNSTWDVVFVDNDDQWRAPVVKKVANSANYIVIHDSDDPTYNYESIFPLFKYQYHYTKAQPNTSVLSNTIELSWLDEV